MNIKTVLMTVLLGVILFTFTGCGENDYQQAGEEFGIWTKKDPATWTDVQKKYYNDFVEWSSNN